MWPLWCNSRDAMSLLPTNKTELVTHLWKIRFAILFDTHHQSLQFSQRNPMSEIYCGMHIYNTNNNNLSWILKIGSHIPTYKHEKQPFCKLQQFCISYLRTCCKMFYMWPVLLCCVSCNDKSIRSCVGKTRVREDKKVFRVDQKKLKQKIFLFCVDDQTRPLDTNEKICVGSVDDIAKQLHHVRTHICSKSRCILSTNKNGGYNTTIAHKYSMSNAKSNVCVLCILWRMLFNLFRFVMCNRFFGMWIVSTNTRFAILHSMIRHCTNISNANDHVVTYVTHQRQIWRCRVPKKKKF